MVQQIEIHQTFQCSAQRSLVIKRKIVGHPWQHGKGTGETVPIDTRAPEGGGVEDMGGIVQLTQPRAAAWYWPETGLARLIPVLAKPLQSLLGWITGKDRAGYRPHRSADDPLRLYTVDQHLLVDAAVEGAERIAAAQNKSHVRNGAVSIERRYGGHHVPCCTGIETRPSAGKFQHLRANKRPYRRCQPEAEWRAETPSALFLAAETCSQKGDMTGKHEATPGRLVGAEQQATAQGDAKPTGITKPEIVAGSGRGGLSGGADPGSTGTVIAGSDVGVAGIGGQSTSPADKIGRSKQMPARVATDAITGKKKRFAFRRATLPANKFQSGS